MSSSPASFAALAAASTGASVTTTTTPTPPTSYPPKNDDDDNQNDGGSFVVNLKYGKTVAPFPVPSLSTTLAELRTMMQADPSRLGSPAGEELVQAPFMFEYDDVRGHSTQRVFRSHEQNVQIEDVPGDVIHLVYDKDAGLAMMEEIEAKAAVAAAAAAASAASASASASSGGTGGGRRYKQTPTKKKRSASSASNSSSNTKQKKPKQSGGGGGGGNTYLVEDIMDRRKIVRKGKRGRKPAGASDKDVPTSYQYRVRWVGYTPDEDTWEPWGNLGHEMKKLVTDRWWPNGVNNTSVSAAATTSTNTSTNTTANTATAGSEKPTTDADTAPVPVPVPAPAAQEGHEQEQDAPAPAAAADLVEAPKGPSPSATI